MLCGGYVSVKQLSSLLVNRGFRKCELWTQKEYLYVHSGTRKWRSLRIASRKIELLCEAGFGYKYAHRMVLMQGRQPVNRKTLSLLGKPVWTGSVEELAGARELWERLVSDCHLKGLFRRKLQIIIRDKDADTEHLQVECSAHESSEREEGRERLQFPILEKLYFMGFMVKLPDGMSVDIPCGIKENNYPLELYRCVDNVPVLAKTCYSWEEIQEFANRQWVFMKRKNGERMWEG